jgi:hypothetical protein
LILWKGRDCLSHGGNVRFSSVCGFLKEHFNEHDWGRIFPFSISAGLGAELGVDPGDPIGGVKMKQLVALAGGLDYATVSRAIRRFEERMGGDKDLAELFQKAKSQ